MASAKQKAWREKFARMAKSGKWRKGKRRVSIRKRASSAYKKVYSMARKRYRRQSGMGGIGGLTAQKNLIGTVGGALVAQKMGFDPRIGAAAGSYFYGKKGIVGAGVGYVAAPYIASMLGGMLGGNTNSGF
jgi:hypothetical protein